MYLKNRVGFFVWGGLIAIGGLSSLLSAAQVGEGAGGLVAMGLIALLGGAALIFAGIMRVRKVKRINAELRSEGDMMKATCHNCNQVVDVPRIKFQVHKRNFPEGYVYCPFCKTQPLSIKIFTPHN